MTLFEQLPPYDSDAESSVVASLLVDETLMNRLASVLDARDFLREVRR